jgi:hypothetical protein
MKRVDLYKPRKALFLLNLRVPVEKQKVELSGEWMTELMSLKGVAESILNSDKNDSKSIGLYSKATFDSFIMALNTSSSSVIPYPCPGFSRAPVHH